MEALKGCTAWLGFFHSRDKRLTIETRNQVSKLHNFPEIDEPTALALAVCDQCITKTKHGELIPTATIVFLVGKDQIDSAKNSQFLATCKQCQRPVLIDTATIEILFS